MKFDLEAQRNKYKNQFMGGVPIDEYNQALDEIERLREKVSQAETTVDRLCMKKVILKDALKQIKDREGIEEWCDNNSEDEDGSTWAVEIAEEALKQEESK